MSPKLLAGLGEPLQYHSLLDRALLDNESGHYILGDRIGNESSLEFSDCYNECNCHVRTSDHSCAGSFCFDSGCAREGGERGVRRGGGEGGERREEGVKPGAVRSPAASSPVSYMYIYMYFHMAHAYT